MDIDYKTLLRKYMQEIIDLEGCSYVGYSIYLEPHYTKDERETLEDIERSIHGRVTSADSSKE